MQYYYISDICSVERNITMNNTQQFYSLQYQFAAS